MCRRLPWTSLSVLLVASMRLATLLADNTTVQEHLAAHPSHHCRQHYWTTQAHDRLYRTGLHCSAACMRTMRSTPPPTHTHTTSPHARAGRYGFLAVPEALASSRNTGASNKGACRLQRSERYAAARGCSSQHKRCQCMPGVTVVLQLQHEHRPWCDAAAAVATHRVCDSPIPSAHQRATQSWSH